MPGPTEPAWIAWVMLLPFAAATASFLTWRLGAKIGLSAAFINAIVSVTLVVQVRGGGTVTHHVAGWGTPLGIELRADGLACLMLILTATVGMAVSVYASGYFPAESRQQRFFWPLWLLLLGGLNALFLSADVFNLYVTLEIVGLAAVALASLPGTAAALNAAMRYLLVSLLGSLFYLLGVSLLYAEHQLLDLVALGSVMEPGAITWLAIALMTAGLLMKAAVFPLHFWLPPAHANAPAPVSAILSALVVKASFYLLLRLWFELFAPAVTGTALHWIGALGAAAILWGSLLACYQRRLKLLVAYSTVAQLGYLFVAFPLVTATEGIGYGGAVYFALSHGFAKAAMFFSAGTMLHAAGHDRIDDLSEIAPHMPVSMLAFGLSGLSLMGLPPSGGFIAKWMLLEATLQSGLWWLTATILIGGLLAGVYVYRVVSCAFAPGTARSFAPTLRRLEWSALVLAVIACLLGLTPNAPLALVSEGPDLSAQLFGGLGHEVAQATRGQPMTQLAPVSVHSAILLAVPLLPLLLAAGLALPACRGLCLRLAAWAALPALASAFLVPLGTTVSVPVLLDGARFGMDQTSQTFLLFTSLLWLLAGLFGSRYLADDPRRGRFTAFYLTAMSGSLGLNICLDPASFFVLFAVMGVSSFGLVVHDGSAEARRAARVYIALAILGETLLFVAVIKITGAGFTELPYRDPAASNLVIALVLVSFGIKAGALPLHFWLPLAHPAAPIPASAVLSGAMIKAGLLGWLRFLPIGAVAAPHWGIAVVIAGLAAAFYGALVGSTKDNPKAVLAYSSISQMGLITIPIGIALAVPDAAPMAIVAALLYAVHHGLAKGTLFLGVGMAHNAGRWRGPVFLTLLLPAAALSGLPLTSGAVAKTALKGAAVVSSWYVWLGPLMSLAAVGTTVLMARYLVNLQVSLKKDHTPKPGLWVPWVALQLAAGSLIWLLPLAGEARVETLSPGKVWPSVWPPILGVLLSVILWNLVWRHVSSPEGGQPRDILRAFETFLWCSGAALARVLHQGELRLRDWPIAGVVFLLTIAVLFLSLAFRSDVPAAF